MELFIYDLIMFRDKKTTSISLETIHSMRNVKDTYICVTNHFKFDESNLKILNEQPKMLTEWYAYYDDSYNDDVEIAGIWRFNEQTKNYEVVYYEN